MSAWAKRARLLACCGMLASGAGGADEDDAVKSAEAASGPALNSEQQQAVGLRVAHPLAATAPERTPALGVVLDATSLLADVGELTAAAAAEHSASAELARLHELYKGGAGASLKMLETAQAEQAKSQAEAQLASARLSTHWGPFAAMSPPARQKILDAAIAGRGLLVRADLPGRHSLGALPAKAVLDVDGIEVPGRILGVLTQFNELQSAGLLIEVEHAPLGLGPGARVPLTLLRVERTGFLLPRDSFLYDENGAYVYKQLTRKTAAKSATEKTRYVPVKVKLLLPYGDGWLVEGVDDDDDIVVHGAGVLWSLQGVGAHAVDDDDD
jgi:hypothetical protein